MTHAESTHVVSARPEIDVRLAGSPGLGADALALLRGSAVAVIGLGALGGPVGMHLALLGVALVLVDPDLVAMANLGNQLWPAASVGEEKSVARARQLAALNPECPTASVTARIEDLGLAALAGVDLLLTGLDGRAARMRVAEVSLRLGIPWVDAAVDGSGRALRGTVTVFDPRTPASACYGCRLDAADLGAIAKEGRGPGCPSWRRETRTLTPPTLQASAFGGVVAGYQAIVASRVLLGRAGDLVGKQVIVECDAAPRVRVLGLTPNPRCLVGHHRLAPLSAVAGEQIGDLLAAAAADFGTPVESLGFHGRMLALGLACPRCGVRRDVVRVAEAVSDAEAKCACGVEMVPEQLLDEVPAEQVGVWAERTWKDVGLPVADVVTARAGGVEAHYVVNIAGDGSFGDPIMEAKPRVGGLSGDREDIPMISEATVTDPIRADFLEAMVGEARAVNQASDVARLGPRPGTGAPPAIYDGTFDGVEHFEQLADGTVAVSATPVRFSISFPTSYLRSGDPRLQFQVAQLLTPILHPNVSRSVVCLGPHFAPGTGLRALVQQLYGIVSGHVFATDHAFDATARQYFLSHLDDVKALRAKPLWRRQLARRVRVERLDAAGPPASTLAGADTPTGRPEER